MASFLLLADGASDLLQVNDADFVELAQSVTETDAFLLLVDGASNVLLTNGVDFLLLEQGYTVATLTKVVAVFGPQLGGQTVSHMIGY